MENLKKDALLDNKRAIFLLVLGCFLVYANSLSGDFIFDDTMQIVGNNTLHSWQNIVNGFTSDVWAFQRATNVKDIPPPYYRPLFTDYLTIGYQLFGLWQQGWHLLNLAIHTGATVLVYRLFLRLSGDNIRLALIGGIFFALIPVHVESVSWISGVPDPLAALFYIPAMIFYIRWREESDKKLLIFSVLFFLLSLLCKETPIVLPLILLIWELTLNRRNNANINFFTTLKQVAIFAIPVFIYLIIRISVLGQINWKHSSNSQLSPQSIYLTIPLTVVYYLKNIIFPYNLSLIYPTGFIKNSSDLNLWIPLAILAVLAGLLYFFRHKITPLMWFAGGLFIIPLLPVLNLQVFHPEYLVQDRYLYLPSIGFVLFIAALLEKLLSSERKIYRQAALAAVAVLCIFYAVGTILQNRVWRSEIDLWTRAAETKSDSSSIYYNLALAQFQNKKYEEAIQNLNTSLKYPDLDNKNSRAYTNLGLAKKGLGRNEEAKKDFLLALELDPQSLEAIINLGAAAFDGENFAEAEAQFNKAVQLKPADISVNYNLARTVAKLGRHKEAINIYTKILPTAKQDAELLYYTAISYEADGQKEKALNLLNEAAKFAKDETLKKQIADELQKFK
jgi:protein O-mannosyl-transferase